MRTITLFIQKTPVRWLITVLWMVFLTWLLVQPETQPLLATVVPPAPPSWQRELVFSGLHGLIFSFTAVLWSWTLYPQLALRVAVSSAAVGLFIYGIGTELGQARVPGRSPQAVDLLANGIGVVVGAWLFYRWLTAHSSRGNYSPIHM